MRKNKLIGLLLYMAVFCSVICLQTYALTDMKMRVFVNLATAGIAAVGGVLFWLLFRSEKGALLEVESSEKEKEFVTKENYVTIVAKYGLTKRELELGFLILSGYSNQRIAEELFISETTVKKHVTHIYEKTGVQSRKEFKHLFENVSE